MGVRIETETLQRRISHTDTEIDKLVYQLYALTDEEIEIIDPNYNLA